MSDLNDIDFAARAEKALALAENATDPTIAAIHRRTAASYLELAKMKGRARGSPPPPPSQRPAARAPLE